jgi:hypothetical protein
MNLLLGAFHIAKPSVPSQFMVSKNWWFVIDAILVDFQYK